ncbi:hypothetical protein DL769_010501 [Monosporascus sp. CRB-8-3]|nr:hypothetical protein DL769_010501 [Monosporascus sp. CRB-8-3]
MTLLNRGLAPAPGSVQSVSIVELDGAVANFADAFGAAESVLQYNTLKAPVLPTLPARTALRFSSDATYLLVGCLNDLRRSLTSWMMDSGAWRFTSCPGRVLMRRWPLSSSETSRRPPAIVQVDRGDATSEADVLRAVEGVPAKYPIKGVIHATMVLRDGLFRSMLFENWKTAVEPKVLGARNLHSVPADANLDFFIMTGSVSGILGTSRRSNYTVANSYLDSLGTDDEQLLEEFEAAIASRHARGRVPDHIIGGLDPVMLQKAASDAGEISGGFWLEDARLSHVVHDMALPEDTAAEGAGASASILESVKATESSAEAVAAVVEHFIGKLAKLLMLSPEDFEVNCRLRHR